MKAIISKNNNFETVGLQAYVSNTEVFSWGVSHISGLNYTKAITNEETTLKVIELIKLNSELSSVNNFSSNFFDALLTNEQIKKLSDMGKLGKGFSLTKNRETIAKITEKIKKIIESIK